MKKTLAAILCVGAMAVTTASASAQSRAECDAYARDYANSMSRPGADAAGGALLGAGLGAVIGGIAAGRPGVGAAIGAGAGAAAGLATNSPRWRRAYDDAYADCRSRGRPARYQAPAVVDGGRYAAWSPGWYEYCQNRYRSFNSRTGYYRGYDGQDHFCVVP